MNTLLRYFDATGDTPGDFDLILTGDLGEVGGGMLVDLMKAKGIDISNNYDDCGRMIYRGIDHPDVNAGGSGCGCAASVMAAHIIPEIKTGDLRRVLFLATGAMMSPSSIQQGLSIPAVAHGIVLEAP
jgi:stage V sporulation protein AD